MIKSTASLRRLVSFSLFLLVTLGGTRLNAADATLSDDLRALEAMRDGLDTPTDQVQVRGKALLEKYSDPGQKALIHYQLAFIYDQSGLTRPDLVAEHSEAALNLPSLNAAKRLQLYCFLCDAKQTMNRVRSKKDQQSFVDVRREATDACLQGLKESTKYDLPETKPELPSRSDIGVPIGDPKDPAFKQRVAQANQENEEYTRRRDQTRQDQEAWENRRILYDQIVDLYNRQPSADEEMRELATRSLPPAMVKVLLDRFHDKAGMRQPKLEPPQSPLGATQRLHRAG